MAEQLTEMVKAYQKDGRGRDALMTAISRRIYRLPKVFAGCDDDTCSDFFLFFYPKLSGMIRRYRDQGSSFESYLITTCRYQLKGFLGRRKRAVRKERIGDSAAFWITAEPHGSFPDVPQEDGDLPVPLRHLAPAHRPEPAPPAAIASGAAISSEAASVGKRPRGMKRADTSRDALRRRLLMFAMRGVAHLQDDDYRHLSRLIGLDPEWVCDCAHRLRERVHERSRRVDRLRERRNGLFFRIHLLQDELNEETGVDRRNAIQRKLEETTTRLRDLQQAVARAQRQPSHGEIAEALEFPKGSVDSGLYYLRKFARTLYPDCRFGYADVDETSFRIRQSAQTAGDCGDSERA